MHSVFAGQRSSEERSPQFFAVGDPEASDRD
jgi:hypothetical protein